LQTEGSPRFPVGSFLLVAKKNKTSWKESGAVVTVYLFSFDFFSESFRLAVRESHFSLLFYLFIFFLFTQKGLRLLFRFYRENFKHNMTTFVWNFFDSPTWSPDFPGSGNPWSTFQVPIKTSFFSLNSKLYVSPTRLKQNINFVRLKMNTDQLQGQLVLTFCTVMKGFFFLQYFILKLLKNLIKVLLKYFDKTPIAQFKFLPFVFNIIYVISHRKTSIFS